EAWRRSHDCRQLQQEWLADDALRESDPGEPSATRSQSALFLTRGVLLGPTEGSAGLRSGCCLPPFPGLPWKSYWTRVESLSRNGVSKPVITTMSERILSSAR